MDMDIFRFQSEASTQIALRFKEYMADPCLRTRNDIVPFYQNLSAITGAGKTLILADAISQIRMQLSIEPIVLWISKGKVVVSQTYNNLLNMSVFYRFYMFLSTKSLSWHIGYTVQGRTRDLVKKSLEQKPDRQ